jgi:hypothetical protein
LVDHRGIAKPLTSGAVLPLPLASRSGNTHTDGTHFALDTVTANLTDDPGYEIRVLDVSWHANPERVFRATAHSTDAAHPALTAQATGTARTCVTTGPSRSIGEWFGLETGLAVLAEDRFDAASLEAVVPVDGFRTDRPTTTFR